MPRRKLHKIVLPQGFRTYSYDSTDCRILRQKNYKVFCAWNECSMELWQNRYKHLNIRITGTIIRLLKFSVSFNLHTIVGIYIYIYIYIYIFIGITMTRKCGTHLRATYGTLNSCFDLNRTHQQCIPWSPPVEFEPTTTVCRGRN